MSYTEVNMESITLSKMGKWEVRNKMISPFWDIIIFIFIKRHVNI